MKHICQFLSALFVAVLLNIVLIDHVQAATIPVGGNISIDTTWSNGNVYYVTSDVTVISGVILTVEPGAIVKFQSQHRLIIVGKLTAIGTSINPVYFTSYRDDSVGGDTNEDGATSGMPGDWSWIEFTPSSDDTSTIAFAVIRYGGYRNVSPYNYGLVYIQDASPTIANCTLSYGKDTGAYLISSSMGGSHPIFNNNYFTSNNAGSISMDPLTLPTFSGNTIGTGPNGINIRSGTISSSVTWDQSNLPYRFVGTVTVNLGATLTIGPDMIFKFDGQERLVISGKLLVNGSAGHEVSFTSYRDDSIGGDTNGDGATSGAPGDWSWIEFTPSSDDTSTISFAIIRYGGYRNISPYNYGLLYIQDASPTIQNSTLSQGKDVGAYLISSEMGASHPRFIDNHFMNNLGGSMNMDPTSQLTLSGNTVGTGPNGINIRSGTISSSVTWDQANLIYRLVGTVTVNLGATLTIGPEMIFKVNSQQRLVISGKLLVNGSVGSEVHFTSYRDDSIGGDTNGDGSTSGSPGDWGWIEFAPSSDNTSMIQHAVIRYGGYMNVSPYGFGNLYVKDASPSIENCKISNSTENGVLIESSSMVASYPILTNNEFTANEVAAISIDPTSSLVLSGNIATGNGTNGVDIRSGIISSSVTWNQSNLPYRFVGTVTVNSGTTLTIGPDMVFKGNSQQRLIIAGKLLVNGSLGHLVYFTSFRDDGVRGDTNGDGATSGLPGDWGWIEFTPTSDDTSIISFAVIRYGGYRNVSPYHFGNIYIQDSSPTFENCVISNSIENGALIESSSMLASLPHFTNNTFTSNEVGAISIDPTSLVTLSGNTASGNGTNGVDIRTGTISTSVTWDQTNLPFRFVGTTTVDFGVTLTIGPDMIFKSNSQQRLVISGKLLVNGSAGHLVYFTSYRDDSIGGDTNGDGATTGAPGDWGWLEFSPTSDDTSVITFAIIRYGGYRNVSPYNISNINLQDASPTIQDSVISHSSRYGIYANNAAPILTCNDIFSNTDKGLFNNTPPTLVVAENHWWGSASGPYHPTLNPTGTGNGVSDGVDFIPWLTSPCHTPPNAPTNLNAFSVSETQIGVNWQDNSVDETEFRVERSPNGTSDWQEIAVVLANVTSFPDDGFTCSSTPQYYRVRAFRQRDGEYSSYSNIDSAATFPCKPSDLSADGISQSQINLTWQDNSPDESLFEIERSLTGSSGWALISTVATNSTGYQNTGLMCGTSYYYRIRAYRQSDTQYSSFSDIVVETTLPCHKVYLPLLLK